MADAIADATMLRREATQIPGSGPALHFYKKLLNARRHAPGINEFLDDPCNLELCYCVLGLWGMDSRRAQLKEFSSFHDAVQKARPQFSGLESAFAQGHTHQVKKALEKSYTELHIMKGNCKLVANSKLNHFLFPEQLMPADSRYTQGFLYGGPSDSTKRYLEIISFAEDVKSEVDNRKLDWGERLDDGWNTTIPKIIDNAIIIVQRRRESIKKIPSA